MIMDEEYTPDSPQQASLALQQAINYQAINYQAPSYPASDLVWAQPAQYQVSTSHYESYTNSHLEYISPSPSSFHPSNVQRHSTTAAYGYPAATSTSREQSNISSAVPSPTTDSLLRALPQASTSGSTNHLRPPRFRPQLGVTIFLTGQIL